MFRKWLKILSLEGGGARGVYTLGVLKKLKSILQYLDILIGTSTGGIIVLALAVGIDPEVIIEWYYNKLPKIFSRSFKYKVSSLFGLNKGKYPHDGLVEACKEFFGEIKMKNLPRRTVVMAYETISGNIARIDSTDPKYGEMYVWEAAVATASAPTYFPSYRTEDANFIDGGLFAGSPAKEGLRLSLPNLNPVWMLNIGTGYRYYRVDTKKWGIKEWMLRQGGNPLSTINFQSTKQSDHDYLHDLAKYSDDTFRFYAVDTELNEGIGMDTIDRTLLEALYELGLHEEVQNIIDDLESTLHE